MCKLKKVSNAKREGGQGEEEKSDEEAPPVEGGGAEGVAAAREAPLARGKGAASTAPTQSTHLTRHLKQPGARTFPVHTPAYFASTALRMNRCCKRLPG